MKMDTVTILFLTIAIIILLLILISHIRLENKVNGIQTTLNSWTLDTP